MDLKQKIKQLPDKPGIYLMKDSLGNIIYVGKAKNIKKRVSQYFQKSKAHSPKITKMIQNIYDLETMTTDTELEAFLTECKFIKAIKPMYNSQMKNDRRYSYIKLSMDEKFPRISIAPEICDDRSEYFGPYTSLHRVEQAVDFIRDYYKIRKCSAAVLKKRSSGCLNYELGLCLGVCSSPEKTDDYKKCIQNAAGFLEGNDCNPVIDLQARMDAAAGKLDFEKAVRYREYMNGIRHVMNKQRLINSSQYCKNIIAVEYMRNSAAKVFFIKGNRMLGTETLPLDEEAKASAPSLIKKCITDYFGGINIQSRKRLGQQDMDEAQIIYSYLKKNKENILSFWIPSNWVIKDRSRMDEGINKIIGKIFSGR